MARTRKTHIPVTAGYYEDKYFRAGPAATTPTRCTTLADPAAAPGDADLLGRVVPRGRARLRRSAARRCSSTRPRSAREPDHPDFDTQPLWQHTIVGHAHRQRAVRRGAEPLRHRGADHLLRVVVHRRPLRPGAGAGAARRGRACSSPTSTSRRAGTGSTCSRSCRPAAPTPTPRSPTRCDPEHQRDGLSRVPPPRRLADAGRVGAARADLDGLAVGRLHPRRHRRRTPRRPARTWAAVAHAVAAVRAGDRGRATPGDVEVARATSARHVDVVEAPLDDAWMRDIGPTLRRSATTARSVPSTGCSTAGAPRTWAALGARRAARRPSSPAWAGAERSLSDLVNEGGGIHVDGLGTVLLTETVQLDPGRNPGLTRGRRRGRAGPHDRRHAPASGCRAA